MQVAQLIVRGDEEGVMRIALEDIVLCQVSCFTLAEVSIQLDANMGSSTWTKTIHAGYSNMGSGI